MGISKLQFWSKKTVKHFQLNFFLHFWSSKPWIRIQIHLKCLMRIFIRIWIQWIRIHDTASFYNVHIQYTWTYALVVYSTVNGNTHTYDSHAFSGLNIDKNGWFLCGASVQIVLCPAHASTQLITPPSLATCGWEEAEGNPFTFSHSACSGSWRLFR